MSTIERQKMRGAQLVFKSMAYGASRALLGDELRKIMEMTKNLLLSQVQDHKHQTLSTRDMRRERSLSIT